MNFDEEIKGNLELGEHITSACSSMVNSVEDPIKTHPNAPKLDTDFSKYFLLNNLPKCDSAKAPKLKTLLVKLFTKKNIVITEDDINMPMGNGGLTEGCAFILASNEE